MAHAQRVIRTAADLFAWDEMVDAATCGIPLADPGQTRLRDQGAHDPTPTPYFILEELFAYFSLTEASRLLDVGCGTGRALAYFLKAGLPGRATGIELDSQLAQVARSWTAPHPNVRALQGNVLFHELAPYTDFYLFNPFDADVLRQFVARIELQVQHPCTVVHMSDNGDSWWYENREGWSQMADGSFQSYRNTKGRLVRIYETPQHYTVWRYDPG